MPVPHTRPVTVTAHATRRQLIEPYPVYWGEMRIPGSVSALLELRLGEAGIEAMGFAVHVPHYVSQAAYPAAAAQLVREVAKAGGLLLPVETLDAAAEETRRAIDEQVQGSPEVAEVVRQLEVQYDAFVSGQGRSLLDESQLPSADELGAELERFLAEQPPRD
jgi:hypothetical protein